MKLGNLVNTFENLAENEELVPGPIGSEFPEDGDPTDGLDLSGIPLDDLPESAMTDLEVTMEEEIFQIDQIDQQLSLLQDTMDVIKSTGVVTEAQQRIINIQLRGLEKHMPEGDRALMRRYTSAPYDPATVVTVTNEAFGAGMSLAIAAIFALAAVMAFMAKGMNTTAARAVSGAKVSSAIKVQTEYANISDKSKFAVGTKDLPKEDKDKFQQAIGSALSWPCSFSGHEIIDLANVQKGRLVNFNVKYLGDAIYEFGNILNRHTDALSKALKSNDQAAVNAAVQELNSSTETFQTFLTTESTALSGSLARRLGVEGNSAVYGVSVIKGTFGYAFEVDLSTRRISKVNLGGLGEEMVRYSADSFDDVSKIEIKDIADGVGYEQIDKDRDLMLKASKSIESLANAAKDEIEALANGRAEINAAFGRAKDSIRTGVEMLGYIVNMTNIGIPRAVTAGLKIGLTPLK